MKRGQALWLAVAGLGLLLAIVVIGAMGGWRGFLRGPAEPVVAVSVPADAVDPLNEGRLVSVQGKLESASPPLDEELGVVDRDAVVLIRDVEMYQWEESCIGDSCTQSPVWSSTLIDAAAFHEQEGHVNPAGFPFASARFVARGIHIGAFEPDLDLLLAQIPLLARPLRLSELPANLAASASEIDGHIHVGNDPLQPAVGDLRIGYRVVPAATTILEGIQDGRRLAPAGRRDPA